MKAVAELLLGDRWLLGLVLLTSGAAKLTPPGRAEFAIALRRYGLLDAAWGSTVNVVLPWLELCLAGLLCVGVMLVPTAATTAALLTAFAAIVGFHAARGNRFSCGCGHGQTTGWRLVCVDMGLSLLAVAVAIGPSNDAAIWPGWTLTHVGVSTTALLPVPLVVILAAVSARLLAKAREISRRVSSQG